MLRCHFTSLLSLQWAQHTIPTATYCGVTQHNHPVKDMKHDIDGYIPELLGVAPTNVLHSSPTLLCSWLYTGGIDVTGSDLGTAAASGVEPGCRPIWAASALACSRARFRWRRPLKWASSRGWLLTHTPHMGQWYGLLPGVPACIGCPRF